MSIRITLPDNSQREVPEGTTLRQFVKDLSNSLARKAVVARVDGHLTHLNAPVEDVCPDGCRVEILTSDTREALEVLRHSTAHVMAEAVQSLFPEAQVTIGPVTEDGFYYDFNYKRAFTPEDLEAIEKKMKEIIGQKLEYTVRRMTKEEAAKRFPNEPFKQEILEGIPEETVTLYTQGEGGWTDLCRGPHLPNTEFIKAFKLTSVAGAYWRGDEKNPMLQRIYGTAYFSQEELEQHLKRIEEAKKRDHRRLGKELDLFSVADEVGGGLVLWHPKGAIVRKLIEDFWREQHLAHGYDFVYSPHVGKSTLWETSGHLGFYNENMYAAMDVEGQDYYVKPMNCPFHMMIYKSKLHSYRELPMRFAELGTVYRFERSGVLHGLMRVRGFTQDDAHLFVSPDGMEDEVMRVIDFVVFMLNAFGFDQFEAYIATRPDKAVGEVEKWDRAIEALKAAATKAGLKYEIDEGGGAFYGPKIDIKIKDSLGRAWQCSTIQFDFNLPERFDLTFIGSDNQPHRPFVIHRALLGSIERFFGVLVEHYGGAFPAWLAPVQAVVVPISQDQSDYAHQVAKELKKSGIRVQVDDRNESLNYRIRESQTQKIPYTLVVGKREVEDNQVSVRRRGQEGSTTLTPAQVVASIEAEHPLKRNDVVVA